jgi:uncharacterized protein involved in cysteine biosynthesis
MAAPFFRSALRLFRGLAFGAWQLPKAFLFLARRPRLWPAAVLPTLAAAALMALGFGLGVIAAPHLEVAVLERGPSPSGADVVIGLGARVVSIVTGVLAGLGLAMILAAPLLDRLSRQVEAATRGEVLNRDPGLRWGVEQSIRAAGYFLLRMPGIVVVGFVPFVGPPLSVLWAAHALAFQNTEPALGRRGLAFSVRRAWHRRHRPESLGLGLASLGCLLVPCAGFLLAPAMITAGTLLVLGLDDAEAGRA